MKTDLSESSFGIIIAYLLPGFLGVLGLSYAFKDLETWLTVTSTSTFSIGGALFITLSSLMVGMVVSTVRWRIIDFIHEKTGVGKDKPMDFNKLQQKIQAHESNIKNHYNYYQFNANMMVSLLLWAVMRAIYIQREFDIKFFLAILVIEAFLFMGSRNALQRYYEKGSQILSKDQEEPKAQD